MTPMILMQALFGFVMLVLGAEVMVKGAAEIAAKFGIPPLIIGLTVVAFGTSAPELAVAIKASLNNQPDIAMGNVVGSNILNILLILGLAAMITPLVVGSRIVRTDIPILISVTLLLFAFAFDGRISNLDGMILFSGSIAYTLFAIFSARKEQTTPDPQDTPDPSHPARSLIFVVAGLAMLVLGADFLVSSAVEIARWLGVSELLIGLTIISIGTSLPEIATTVVAALRGMRDMAVGGVVGSCLFNILAVTGAAAIFSSDGLTVDPALIHFDLPVMLAATVACLPIFATGHLIARWEGLLFFVFYWAYVTYLIMATHSSESVEMMHVAMLGFAIPLTLITLALLWLREIRQKRKDRL